MLSHAFAAGGPVIVTAALPEDALPLDDARTATLDVPRELRALLVDGAPSPEKYKDEAYFVESALGSPASPARPTLIDAEALRDADLSRFDLVFLLNVRSVAGRSADLQRFVEGGGGLFISLGDQVDPEQYDQSLGALLPLQLHLVKTAAESTGEAGAARLARVDEAHPALSVFTGEAKEGLSGARFLRYVLTKPPSAGNASTVLAAFDDGAPALVEARRGRGRVLLYTSAVDRQWGDWPLRTSFLPAMQRFAAWLAGALEERRDTPALVGSPRQVRPAEGRRVRALVAPDGTVLPAPEPGAAAASLGSGLADGVEVAQGGVVTFTPRRCGLWQVRVAERGAERLDPSLAIAVVPDPRESDTRRLRPAELTAWLGGEAHAKVDGPGGLALPGQGVPLWSWLLAAAVLLFLAEGTLLS